MAQYLKILIRQTVICSLRSISITDLIDIWDSLIADAQVPSDVSIYVAPLPMTTMQLLKKDPIPLDRLQNDQHADLCTYCRQTIDDETIMDNLIGFRWHQKCFPLDKKSRDIVQTTWKQTNKGSFDDLTSFGYIKVTQLSQFVFLLKVALRRLHSLQPLDENDHGLARRMSQKMFKRSPSKSEDLDAEEPQIKKSPSLMLRKSPSKKKLSPTEQKLPVDLPIESTFHSNVNQRYFSECSALEHMVIQHFAVLLIAPYVDQFITKQELLESIPVSYTHLTLPTTPYV